MQPTGRSQRRISVHRRQIIIGFLSNRSLSCSLEPKPDKPRSNTIHQYWFVADEDQIFGPELSSEDRPEQRKLSDPQTERESDKRDKEKMKDRKTDKKQRITNCR